MLQDADSGSASQKDLVQHPGSSFLLGGFYEELVMSWEAVFEKRWYNLSWRESHVPQLNQFISPNQLSQRCATL